MLAGLFFQTNNHVNFCTNTENPSELQQERHRKKKLKKGLSTVPSTEKPDGTVVYGFERMHLYGVIGILITADLTQKRRLADHWGTTAHDDYPLVRLCMPHDLFMLFYARFDHVLKMLGVDVADQRLGSRAHVHKPMTYFGRRVFDQKLAQAISNAYLLYYRWAEVLAEQCKGVLAERASDSGGAASGSGAACEIPGGVVANGDDLSVEELTEMSTLLKKMIRMKRTVWVRRMSTHLMSLCQLGTLNSGARRTKPVVASYNSTGAASARVCVGGHCKDGAGKGKYNSARTTGVCWCCVCSNNQGKARALHLCKTCKDIDAAHVTAAAHADRPAPQGRPKAEYKPIVWRS